ncbi:CDP-diacylglycerol--serine O-phosphatidyltransferase [Ruminobacter sp.]|uniref:CDP-diacylglycerol--serine O-phosphatidyltransferase n=1 Tax=Ruminobacter sp. TaxID=2774296 RepID=UPI00386F78DD
MKLLNSMHCLFGSAKYKIGNLSKIAVNADSYNILEDPKVFRERLLANIKNAKSRICICALYWQNDEMGQEVMQAVNEAVAANPKLYVRIYVDFHRAQRGLVGKTKQIVNSDWYRELAKKQLIHPIIYGVPVKRREIFGVFHLKGFIIDDTVLYSGASINNVYLHRLDKYRIDRYHEINSRELADSLFYYCADVFHRHNAVQDFAQDAIPTSKELNLEIKKQRRELCRTNYKISNAEINSRQVGITPLVGLGKKNNILNTSIINLIEAAKEEITICTPYFNFPSHVLKAVNKALSKGVTITIIVGDKEANDFFIHDGEPYNKVGAVPYIYEMNLRDFVNSHTKQINEGILKIRLWKDGLNTYHVKGISVDHRYHLITGNNLNPRAWGLDLENGLLVDDEHHLLLEKITHERNFLLSRTTPITSPSELQTIDDYPEDYRKVILKVRKFGAQWLLRKLL